MDWEPDAAARIERVPFFIRKKVKKQIEQYVHQLGGKKVTDSDVTEARRALAGGNNNDNSYDKGSRASLQTIQGSLSTEELARIESMIEKGVTFEGLNTRYHEVKVCGGAAGCPLSMIEDRPLAVSLAKILGQSGLDRHIAGQIDGPVLFHHKLRVALAGCPNSCSQPQIVDFGIIAQSRPENGEGRCTNCGLCVKACEENAINLTPDGPVFDSARCLNCGHCIQYCQPKAIREAETAFRVLMGGKLGRHPRLADVLLEMADEKQLLALLKAAVSAFIKHGQDGERFAAMVERVGTSRVKQLILETGLR